MAREFVGRWAGRIAEGSDADHERFVAELRTPASAELLRKYSLIEYTLYRRGRDLDVVFKSEKPPIIAGFLRNKRMWPDFWEFTQPGSVDVPADKEVVFRWSLD
jgi:hypothetical protein